MSGEFRTSERAKKGPSGNGAPSGGADLQIMEFEKAVCNFCKAEGAGQLSGEFRTSERAKKDPSDYSAPSGGADLRMWAFGKVICDSRKAEGAGQLSGFILGLWKTVSRRWGIWG